MIESTMIRGPILVKARKLSSNDEEMYLEFQLTDAQKYQFIAELLIEHCKNGKLIVEHRSEDKDLDKMEFLKNIMESNPQMSPETKELILRQIVKLTENEAKTK